MYSIKTWLNNADQKERSLLDMIILQYDIFKDRKNELGAHVTPEGRIKQKEGQVKQTGNQIVQKRRRN